MTHLHRGDYTVRPSSTVEARPLVERLHYAGGASKTGVAILALVRVDDPATPVGIAWGLPPTRRAAESVSSDPTSVLSLSRLVIEPEVPTNGASFLLGQWARWLRRGGIWRTVVTWADEGEGHTGAIYRAANWEYLGRTKPAWRYRAPDGRLMSKKRGRVTYSHAAMLEMGYSPEGPYRKHKFRRVLHRN